MKTQKCPPPSRKLMTLQGATTTVSMAISSCGHLGPQPAQIPVADELDRLRRKHPADDRVAQSAQFGRALRRVAGRLAGGHVTRMTAQFRDALLDLRFQHSREALHADLFEV